MELGAVTGRSDEQLRILSMRGGSHVQSLRDLAST